MGCEGPEDCWRRFGGSRFAQKPWWPVVEPVDRMRFGGSRRSEVVHEDLGVGECERSDLHYRWMVDGTSRIQPGLEAEL